MRRLFWHWALSAIALVLAVAAVPGVDLANWYDALWIAPLLGLVNIAVGMLTWIFNVIFGLVNLLTLGLLGFVFSFLLYSFAVYWLGKTPDGPLSPSMPVESVGAAVLFAALMGLFSVVINMLLPGRKSRKR